MDSVSVLGSLYQSLTATDAQPVVLVGPADGGEGATLLGCASCDPSSPDLRDVADLLPEPLCLHGAFAPVRADAYSAAAKLSKSQLVHGVGIVAAFVEGGALRVVRLRADGTAGAELNVKKLDSLDDWLAGHRIFRCELPLRLDLVQLPEGGGASASAGGSAFARALQAAVQTAVVQLDAPGLAYLAECGTGTGPSGRKLVLLQPDAQGTVAELPGAPAPGSGAATGAGLVTCRPLVDPANITDAQVAPVFSFHPLAPPTPTSTPTAPASGAAAAAVAAGGGGGAGASCRTAVVCLDVLCYVARRCPLRRAVQALTRGLVRQAHVVQRVMEQQGKQLPVRAYHFLPPGLGHHVTLLYPSLSPGADPEADDALLAPLRARLHALLRLPPNRPLLRPANALELAGGGGGGGGGGPVARLRDVHAGLTPPEIGGRTALLQGSYEYCHYMQDKFNDNGWGCAYRSLQTIVSWFRTQRYTTKPIPSHKAVQQLLVQIGDKPPSFVGSSNWIGAIELSYILDEYLGVSSKILTVSRGSDIPSHARELAAHFDAVGTPVMIGGGVLAYTLLGVRFNEATGEAAFLILDPHYTGGEDLKKIHSGTWVGWKRPGDTAAAGGPLFVDDAFYNFLMPQRPSAV